MKMNLQMTEGNLAKLAELLAMIEQTASREHPALDNNDDDYYDPGDSGNFDDCFTSGEEAGAIDFARSLLKIVS